MSRVRTTNSIIWSLVMLTIVVIAVMLGTYSPSGAAYLWVGSSLGYYFGFGQGQQSHD